MTNTIAPDAGVGLDPQIRAVTEARGKRRRVKVVQHPAFRRASRAAGSRRVIAARVVSVDDATERSAVAWIVRGRRPNQLLGSAAA